MGGALDLPLGCKRLVKRRAQIEFVVAAAVVGIAYAALERQTDVWPALLLFLLSGFVAGLVCSSGWVLALCPVAGLLGNLAWRIGGESTAVELPLLLALALGMVIGVVGVPATLLGMYFSARSRSGLQGQV